VASLAGEDGLLPEPLVGEALFVGVPSEEDGGAGTLAAIKNEQMQSFPLFGGTRVVDFSQFKVRGHYQASDTLKRYFQAMMWCGRIDLRVATVLNAEPVPKAKKLLKLEIDLGERRSIVAGIAEHYTPESLIGRQVIIVANLRPAKLMGVISQGMLLAAGQEAGPVLIMPDQPVPPGTALR
jgi:methionine--tRNA ligase beta chain